MSTTMPENTKHLRDRNEITIEIPALPRPTLAELRAKYAWIKKIERDTSPTGPVTLTLGTVLREGETYAVRGTEYERRLAPKQDLLLGFQHREWLLEHQAEFPPLMALLGKVYIDFPGLVVVGGSGGRDVPYAGRVGGGYIYAESSSRSHNLEVLFDQAPRDIQESFEKVLGDMPRLRRFPGVRKALEAHNGMFIASRYPFESGSELSDVEIETLTELLQMLDEVIGEATHRWMPAVP